MARHQGSTRARWYVSLGVTATWLLLVVWKAQAARALANWPSALTMLAGSFLAGSSPEGGGAVAFPVFTKGLDVPPEVARSFGLSIQAVGMTTVAIGAVAAGRPYAKRAAFVGSAGAGMGFLATVFLLGDRTRAFWPPDVRPAAVKALFSAVLATTALTGLLNLRTHRARRFDAIQTRAEEPLGADHIPVGRGVGSEEGSGESEEPGHEALSQSARRRGSPVLGDSLLAVVAGVGGFVAALVGTGANLVVYLYLVNVRGMGVRRALTTAIMVMAIVSLVGLLVFGILDGQLDVTVAGDRVVAVGGQPVSLPRRTHDLYGLWLAAVPVVVRGVPLGSWFAAVVSEARLVKLIAFLASVEVASTFILVPEVWREVHLFSGFVLGVVGLTVLLRLAASRRSASDRCRLDRVDESATPRALLRRAEDQSTTE